MPSWRFDAAGGKMLTHTLRRGVRDLRTIARQLRWDLGARNLMPEWKIVFSKEFLREDVLAGITVACVALPLSLAIALASDVQPGMGLITAIIAGILCALFGGTRLAVSGPAAAMAVLVASVVEKHGAGGLLVVGFLAGLMQLFSGILRLGRLVRFVPVPVVAGFTAGIGATILIQQAPRALGLPPPDSSHAIDVLQHAWDLLHHSQLPALGLSLGTVAIIFLLPRFFPRLPAVLIGVVVASTAAALGGLDVATIGAIPRTLPMPRLPPMPEDWFSLLATAFLVYAVASLETLLSASAVDKIATGERHDPDQELVGQGLGNVAAALFGGIPATSVIARSALNVQSGARTRRSGIIHSLVLITMVFVFAPLIEQIPIAVLAGVLLSIALRMLNPRELVELWNVSRFDAITYVVTFLVLVFVDLLAGVQAGIVAALAIMAFRLGRSHVLLHETEHGPYRLSLSGPLTFLASAKIDRVRAQLKTATPERGIVLDMSDVVLVDGSAVEQLIDILGELHASGWRIALLAAPKACRSALEHGDRKGFVSELFAVSEADVARTLTGNTQLHSHDRLVMGVQNYRNRRHAKYEALFGQLADGQMPHSLFITCSDSRIQPNLITSTSPGELFIVRNVGNIIPPYGTDSTPAENAAIEYAIEALGVQQIVVCGHSGCGAMRAILSQQPAPNLPSVSQWLSGAYDEAQFRALLSCRTPEEAAQRNVLQQIENLRSNPLVRLKLEQGAVELLAWYYDIGRGEIIEWNQETQRFVSLSPKFRRTAEKR